jgi:hypothetical protein
MGRGCPMRCARSTACASTLYCLFARNKPFRSCPISAKIPSELPVAVKENPSSEPENLPVAVAGWTSPTKFVGSVGSEDCGWKCSTGPEAVQVMCMLTVAGTPPGAKNWKSSSTDACSTWSSAVWPSISSASSGTCTIQNKPDGWIPPLKSCTCNPELGSKRSIQIKTNVPR